MAKKSKLISIIIVTGFAIFMPGCRKQPQTKNKIETTGKVEEKKHKYFRDLTYDELKINKERLVKEGKKDAAINHLEKMIPLSNDIEELRDMTLEIADLLFETGNLKKSEILYRRFVQLYPSDKNTEYASYKGILCGFWQTLDSQRDQTKTKDTIQMAEEFIERSDVFTKYTGEVSKILVQCNNSIFESEENIFRFYINRGDFLSAKNRLENMEKEFKALEGAEPKMILLACELAEAIDDKKLLEEKSNELQTKFPNYQETITLAQNNTTKDKDKKSSFVDKF